MFEYMTAQEAAEKWNVSLRWEQRLCKENRIDGAMNINRVWLIPKVAKKPVDRRAATFAKEKWLRCRFCSFCAGNLDLFTRDRKIRYAHS